MNRAIFLDKDGTVVDDTGYPASIPRDKILIKEALAGLQSFQNAGYLLVLVSNQSWISSGMLTTEEVEAVFKSVVDQFAQHNVKISGYYYCPHPRTGGCRCRKPQTELFQRAVKDFNIDPKQSYMVGDLPTDIEAGRNFGLKTCLVGSGKGKALTDNQGSIKPDWHARDVNHFAEILMTGDINEYASGCSDAK